jgi:hypothetical protein
VHALVIANIAQLSEFSETDWAFKHLVVATSNYISSPVLESRYLFTPLVDATLLNELMNFPIIFK